MDAARTPEFFNVQPVQAALDQLYAHWTPQRRSETRDPRQAFGRVLAADVSAPVDLPQFQRSAVDGYAVRAADTFGASQTIPAYLHVVGRVTMGAAAALEIRSGQAAEIHTGGMLPPGADAVVMVERTQPLGNDEIEVLAAAAPGDNVIQVGEDVRRGELILAAGRRIRPQDVGGLLAVGILEVEVASAPRVGILSCGDEIIAPEETPLPGQIRDINAHMLAALVERAGGEPVLLGIARDEIEDYRSRARSGFENVDVLVMTAGSSVSTRDLTRAVIDSLGKPGILQHGLAVKPGKPTIIAVCDNRPVIGLPGNPVSAFLVARQIVIPCIKRILGQKAQPAAIISAILGSNIASASGREDSVPVRLVVRDGSLHAEPVFGKSNLIYTLVNADGLVHIPLNNGGVRAGTVVEVTLFDD